jgi:glycosyltransferase involved in cell wall biosynthesis
MKLTIVTPTYQLLDLIYWNVHNSRVKYAPPCTVETIIVDGGSDEYIRKGLIKLENSKINDVKVIFVEGNKHDSYNINAACKIARGEYIVKIDSDVIVRNEQFWVNLLNALESNTNALIGCERTATWTRGHGCLLGGYLLSWKKDIDIKWDEEYVGFGPSDMDFNMQFLDKNYPIIAIPKYGVTHLGGIQNGLFYAKSEEQFRIENKRNHDIYFRKWEKKLSTIKGLL